MGRIALAATLVLFALPASAGAVSWTPITGPTGTIEQVGKVRAPDGTLHVVWTRATPGSGGSAQDIVHATISASGVVGSSTVIASAFASASNPAIVSLPGGGLEVFFGAIQCISAGCPSGLFSATSSDGGATWTAPTALYDRNTNYGSDLNAGTLSDGTPFETWWATLGTFVHRGTGAVAPDYDYQGAMGAGCCGYYSNLAADAAGDLQLAWDSNATGFLGVWSRPVDPGTGAPTGSPLLMPGSVTSYNGVPSHSQMLGRTPIVALAGQAGQFFVAYPGGYPSTTRVLLWRVGSPSSQTIVDEPGDHNAVSLAADAQGRLWVFWTNSSSGVPHVFARRVSALLEPVIDLGSPAGAQSIYALDGDVSPAGDPEALALTGFANGSSGTYYARGPQTAPLASPVLGKSFNAAPVSGTVLVKLPGGHAVDESAALSNGPGFVPLTGALQLPAGTQVDARRGTLNIVTAATAPVGKRAPKTQSGVFGGALFKVTQDRSGPTKGLTSLSILEAAFPGAPGYASCKTRAGDHASAARLSTAILQALRARASGRFRTRGRYSAATVRGTQWDTIDRCDGTLTIVQRGTVQVTDFVHHTTVVVHAGHRYLARAR
jgi:hypothetical protein